MAKTLEYMGEHNTAIYTDFGHSVQVQRNAWA